MDPFARAKSSASEQPALSGAASRSENSWDTKLAAELPAPTVQRPADFFIGEHREISAAQAYERTFERMRRSGSFYPHDSDLYRSTDRIFQKVLEAGAQLSGRPLERADFSLDIVRTPVINAYVYDGEGVRPHICITTGFFEALERRYGAVREGHIAMVLGHELKHFLEGHYHINERETTAGTAEDPLPYERVGVLEKKNAAEDFIFQRAFTREQEFQCDEFGITAAHALGYPTREAIEMLEMFLALETAGRAKAPPPSRFERRMGAALWLSEGVSKTHPASESRVFRARGVGRMLEVEHSASATPSSDHPPSPTLTLPERLLSLEQRSLRELEESIQQRNPRIAFQRACDVATKASQADEPLEERIRALRTLAVMAPAFLAAEQCVVPRQPWCAVSDVKLDAIEAAATHAFELAVKPVRDHVRNLLSDAILELPESPETFVIDLVGNLLPYRGADTPRLTTDQLISTSLLADASTADILAAIDAIEREAIVPINPAVGFGRFYQHLEDAPPKARNHAEDFLLLASQRGRDLRPELITGLLRDGLLEHLDTVHDVVAVIDRVEAVFRKDPDGAAKVGAALTKSISEWIDSRSADANTNIFDDLLRAIKARPGAALQSVDSLTAELLTSQAKQLLPDDLRSQADWCVAALQPSKTRDVVLVRLLESDSEWFARSKVCRRKLTPTAPWSYKAAENLVPQHEGTASEAAKKFLTGLEVIAPHLDLSWAAPTVIFGEEGEANGVESNFATADEQQGDFSSVAVRTEELGYSAPLCRFLSSTGFTGCGPRDSAANEVRFYLRSAIELCFGKQPHQAHPLGPRGQEVLFSLFERVPNARTFLVEGHQGFVLGVGDASCEVARRLYSLIGPETSFGRFWHIDPELNKSFDKERFGDSTDLSDLPALLEKIPPGPSRDFLILGSLAYVSQRHALEERLQFLKELKKTFSLDSVEQAGLFERWGAEYAAYGRRLLSSSVSVEALEQGEERLEIGEQIKREIRKYENISWNLCGDRDPIIVHPGVSGQPWGSETAAANPAFFEPMIGTLRLLSPASSDLRAGAIAIPLDRMQHLATVQSVYSNYALYLQLKCGDRLESGKLPCIELSFPELSTIAAETGRVMYARFDRGRALPGTETEIAIRLGEIRAFMPAPSEQRDRFLLDILESSPPGAALGTTLDYAAAWVKEVYHDLTPTHAKHDLGRRIYAATLQAEPDIYGRFEAHLDLLMTYHSAGTVSREDALKDFIDYAANGRVVRTWAQRDAIEQRFAEERKALQRDRSRLTRQGALMLVLDAVNQLDLPAKERVDTVLWAIGIRPKSHLVECIELLEGRPLPDLKDQAAKLTENEKRELVKLVLAGPNGLLSSTDAAAKREFLDTLFFTVFSESGARGDAHERTFKAIYDCMLHHLDPERAAEFLGNFLVSHLDGQDFNQQVKIFFESFDFIGIKSAQYLVSATDLIPDDMRRTLMDLTSRVEGPPKLELFDRLEKTFGAEAKRLVHSIGRRVGGGSLMSFYEVTLWNDDHSGPGRSGVVGMLRPDVVAKMPEDLRLVSRLIQTMHEAPEIFGGEHVSADLMDSLARQSLVETNIQRTIALQQQMRRDLAGEKQLTVPLVWQHTASQDGRGMTQLSRGPFIFMDFAPGTTLDLYLRRFETTDASGAVQLTPEGERRAREISTRIAKVFFDQIAVHGLVHCDLHPGNILIHETARGIDITLLDVGLSTELSPTMREMAGKLMRIVVGSSHQGGRIQEFVRSFWHGTGAVSERDGKRWIRDVIDAFESVAGEQWPAETKQRGVDAVWGLLNDSSRSAQARLGALTQATRDLGIKLPDEFYYLLRAASITNHLWRCTDWRAIQSDIARLGQSSETTVSSTDVNRAIGMIEKIHARTPLPGYQREPAREQLERAAAARDLFERLTIFRDLCAELSGRQEHIFQNLLHAVTTDRELQAALGLTAAAEKVRRTIAELSRTAVPAEGRTVFVSAAPLEPGTAAERAYLERFGSKRRVWDGILHTGTLLRVSGGGYNDRLLVVESPSPTELHDNDKTLLRPLGHAAKLRSPEDSGLTDAQLKDFLSTTSTEDAASGPAAFDAPDNRASSMADTAEDLDSYEDDEDLSPTKIAEAYGVVFEDARYFEAIRRRELARIDEFYKKPELKAHEELDAVMEGIRNRTGAEFFELGHYLRAQLTITARPQEILSLGSLMNNPAVKIDVFTRGEWQPIESRLVQTGETYARYFEALDEERKRLGLPCEDETT